MKIFLNNSIDSSKIYVNIDLIERYGINTSEAKFLKYMVEEQIKRGDDWIITDFEELAIKMEVKKVTVQRWFSKFSDANILIQQGNRRPLWKINPNLLHFIE